MKFMKTYDKYIDVNIKDWELKAIKSLKEKGVIILRGIVSESKIELINKKVSSILSNPSF